MYRLGIGMFAASLLLLIGWVLYKLCQEGAIDEAVFVLFVVLFVGGIEMAIISRKL